MGNLPSNEFLMSSSLNPNLNFDANSLYNFAGGFNNATQNIQMGFQGGNPNDV